MWRNRGTMLSLSDFREKQILFIKTERKSIDKIKFWNDNIKFTRDGKTINQVSCHKVFAVFIIGDISITSEIIKKCGKYGISVHLLSYGLEEYASFAPESEGNYLLRAMQYKANSKKDLTVSKYLVRNKILNQMLQLSKKDSDLNTIFESIDLAKTNKVLLGIEGNVSKMYFSTIFADIGWTKRIPRAKIDINNLLLDIGYYYLFNFIDSLLRSYGFDTFKGFYHKTFFQRKSLTCDVMEPFRVIIDRQLIKSFNLKQINPNDFYCKNGIWQVKKGQSTKYSAIFVNAVLSQKDEIHTYVKRFYRFVINKDDEMPFYKLPGRLKK